VYVKKCVVSISLYYLTTPNNFVGSKEYDIKKKMLINYLDQLWINLTS